MSNDNFEKSFAFINVHEEKTDHYLYSFKKRISEKYHVEYLVKDNGYYNVFRISGYVNSIFFRFEFRIDYLSQIDRCNHDNNDLQKISSFIDVDYVDLVRFIEEMQNEFNVFQKQYTQRSFYIDGYNYKIVNIQEGKYIFYFEKERIAEYTTFDKKYVLNQVKRFITEKFSDELNGKFERLLSDFK